VTNNLICKFLFLFTLFNYSNALSEVNLNDAITENQKNILRINDLRDIHEALSVYSLTKDKSNLIYIQKIREMLNSVERRFTACDSDNNNALDVYETTQCLPQVARQFRKVDINKDNLIALDEISIIANDYQEKNKIVIGESKQIHLPSVILKVKAPQQIKQ